MPKVISNHQHRRTTAPQVISNYGDGAMVSSAGVQQHLGDQKWGQWRQGPAEIRVTVPRFTSNQHPRRMTVPRVRRNDGNGVRVSSAGGKRCIGQQL